MAKSMHETDIIGWSEDQAARLRRLAAGEEPSDIGVDWSNVIEEIEAVGRGERQAVLSELAIALFHVLMAHGWPGHRYTDRWLCQATTALMRMRCAVDPGMERRLDLGEAYRGARRMAEGMRVDGGAPQPLPVAIPLAFEDLRGEGLSARELLRRVQAVADDDAEEGTAAPYG